MKKESMPFIIFTFSVFICILTPFLVQRGMFLDGITYATMSRNFAEGIATIQKPMYTDLSALYDQPVLGFLIQSIPYKIFGDSIYVEKSFSMLMAILSSIGLILCWRLFTRKIDIDYAFWIPILLWITIPVVSWTYRNNMLDSMITVCSIFSIYFSIIALQKRIILYTVVSALFIVLGFLIKGPVAIFPLIVPLIFGWVFKDKVLGIYYFIFVLLSSIILLSFILYLFPDLKTNLLKYIEAHLFPAIRDEREVNTNYRIYIMWKLFLQLLVPILLCLIFILINRYKGKKNEIIFRKESIFFLLIALSASLPLMVTHKQHKYYITPSLLYYCMAIGFIIAPSIQHYIKKSIYLKYKKAILYFSGILVFSLIIICCIRYDKYSRDKDLIEDIIYLSEELPHHSIISTNNCSAYLLNAYLYRIGYLSLECNENNNYYLIEKGNNIDKNITDNYIKYKELNKYILYIKPNMPINKK